MAETKVSMLNKHIFVLSTFFTFLGKASRGGGPAEKIISSHSKSFILEKINKIKPAVDRQGQDLP